VVARGGWGRRPPGPVCPKKSGRRWRGLLRRKCRTPNTVWKTTHFFSSVLFCFCFGEQGKEKPGGEPAPGGGDTQFRPGPWPRGGGRRDPVGPLRLEGRNRFQAGPNTSQQGTSARTGTRNLPPRGNWPPPMAEAQTGAGRVSHPPPVNRRRPGFFFLLGTAAGFAVHG